MNSMNDKIKQHLLTPIALFVADQLICTMIEKVMPIPSLYSSSANIVIAFRNLIELVIMVVACFFTFKYGLLGLKEAKEDYSEKEIDYYKPYKIICYIGIGLEIITTAMIFMDILFHFLVILIYILKLSCRFVTNFENFLLRFISGFDYVLGRFKTQFFIVSFVLL